LTNAYLDAAKKVVHVQNQAAIFSAFNSGPKVWPIGVLSSVFGVEKVGFLWFNLLVATGCGGMVATTIATTTSAFSS
jgi:hypothetical protein